MTLQQRNKDVGVGAGILKSLFEQQLQSKISENFTWRQNNPYDHSC